MFKSQLGLPRPQFPRGVDLRVEARKARRRLYPVTILYSAYSVTVLIAGIRASASPLVPLAFYVGGLLAWTYLEYLAHRYVLHGRFPDGPGRVRHCLHKSFDHLHYAHHEHPWDGNHINGTIKDTAVPVALLIGLGFLAPLPTLPVLVAGLLQAYILEEWVHQSVHFYDFRGRYFRYIKRHHLYHHSPRGSEVGFGLTNGFWDVVARTRIPEEARRRLYGRGRRSRSPGAPSGPPVGSSPVASA